MRLKSFPYDYSNMKIHFFNEKSKFLKPSGSIEYSLEECDTIFFDSSTAYEIQHKEIQDNIYLISGFGKKGYIFLISDNSDEYEIPENITFFRTSGFRSKLKANEQILPYIWEQFECPFIALPRSNIPTIGFCGMINQWRFELLNTLHMDPRFYCKFIINRNFWGGCPHHPELVSQFRENIKETHFTVCNRGAGNFTMRLYQTMNSGRIPIFVDTDMKLPFEDKIPWDSLVVRDPTIEGLLQKVLKIYSEDIEERQKRCYDTFNRWFRNTDNWLFE
jgi:hypothetical protein